jgi:hypothetical protein
MTDVQIKTVARLVLATLVLAVAPAQAEAGGARLEGYLLGVDGRAASGYKVHLIDGEGQDVAQSSTSDEGVYRFRDVTAGAYSLGIESPEGRMAPVAAPPVRLSADELARRDIKLVESGDAERETVERENYSACPRRPRRGPSSGRSSSSVSRFRHWTTRATGPR